MHYQPKRLLQITFTLLVSTLLLAFAAACSGTAPSVAPAAQSTNVPSAATSAPAAATTAPAAVRDSVVIAQGDDALTLDPAKHSAIVTNNVLKHIYESLVYVDAEGKHQPSLAVSWENIDDLTWQFKLREGVKFHDGSEFDAEAVKFSFDRTLNPDTKSPTRSTLAFIDHVDVVDKYTVNLVTKAPYPLTLDSIVDFGGMILPPNYVKENGEEILATKPVGTGPYKLVEFVKDDHITLQANPDYWGGEPKIKTVTFRPVPEASTRVAGLKSGEFDLIVNLPPEEIAGLQEGADTKVEIVPSGYVAAGWLSTLREGPLQDKRVRQALNYAVDSQAIIDTVFLGNAQRVAVTGVPGMFGYDSALKPYPYDPEKAKQLLAEAGYPNGFTLNVGSLNGITVKDKEAADAVAGYLEQVGITVNREVIPLARLVELTGKKELPDVFYSGWRTAWKDMDAPIFPLLCCGQFFASALYQNPELDKLMTESRSTLAPAERERLLKEASDLIYDEAPHIFLFQLSNIYGSRKDLQWQPKGDTNTEMWRASFQ